MSIQPLPPEVAAQIKSSTTITSLNGVICELVKNALDALSTKVDITVDYTRGGCVLEDDGLGIHPSEFGEDGGLGKLYHTSKLNSETPVHGGRGIFLAALSAMALMSITSHHHMHRLHNTISMHKSEVVLRQTPAPPQQYLPYPNHGTRVTVRDLFGNMPVRVKQRAITAEKQRGSHKDWEELKRDLVMILISWPRHVAMTVREVDGSRKLVIRSQVRFDEVASDAELDVSRICNILTQAAFTSTEEKSSWVRVGISTPSLEIRGTISLQPSAVKNVQFISFGVHPLKNEGQSVLHDEINRLFLNSSFGNKEEASGLDEAEKARRAKDQRFKSDGYTNKELKGRKGVDRWPMFYLNIDQLNLPAASRQMDPDEILDNGGSRLGAITELLEVMITKFLMVHHFRPKPRHGQRSKESKETSRMATQSPANIGDVIDQTGVAVEVKEKSSLKNTKPKFDPLGTNLKVPSFRRSLPKPESPFEGWSRIKSGNPTTETKERSQGIESQESLLIDRPSSAPPLSEKSKTPLIARNGKLLRQPFDDTSTVRPRSKDMGQPTSQPETTQTTIDDDNDLVEWVNPVSKVKSLINRRTGMTRCAKTDTSSLRLSRKSSFRSKTSSTMHAQSQVDKPSDWVSEVLQKWENPVFSAVESSIPQLSLEGPDEHSQKILHGCHHHCSQVDIDRAFKESSAGVSGRISKAALKNAEIISQVDRKFILVKVQTITQLASDSCDGSMLVFVDQHAADERIRIESLMEELCTPGADSSLPESGVLTTLLTKPLIFELSIREVQILREQRSFFAAWGILYEVKSKIPGSGTINTMGMCSISIQALPPGIVERCKQEPRLLIELIRTEAWKAHELGTTVPSSIKQQTWLQRTQSCPQGLLDLLNSRACRGAIMFNDVLSNVQCEKLVRKLADCKFPFQCAHGRPSLVPLVDISTLKDVCYRGEVVLGESNDNSYGHAFRKWKEEYR